MEKARSIPVYMQIVEQIKQRIKSEEFTPGMFLPKEVEFAKEFGVTRSTLRNSLDVLEREGFIERRRSKGTMIAPRECFNKHLHADLAVVTRLDLTNPQNYLDLIEGGNKIGSVVATAIKRGMLIRFVPWCNKTRFLDLDEILFRKGIDGFIFASPMYLTSFIDRVVEEKIPHVLQESHYDKRGVNTVMNDDYKATYECVNKLYKLGHRKIGFLGGTLKKAELKSASRRCFDAFLGACKEFGIQLEENWVQAFGQEYWENEQVDETAYAYSILNGKQKPTAVVTATLHNATAMKNVCNEVGINIPTDLSLISAGGYDFNSKYKCNGFIKDYEQLGTAAVDSLMQWIIDPLYIPTCKMIMPDYKELGTIAAIN